MVVQTELHEEKQHAFWKEESKENLKRAKEKPEHIYIMRNLWWTNPQDHHRPITAIRQFMVYRQRVYVRMHTLPAVYHKLA